MIGGAVDASFFFDNDRLQKLAESYRIAYPSAKPFPHVVIDDFLPEEVMDAVLAEFPQSNDVDWEVMSRAREKKLALADDTQMGPVTRRLLAEFNSATFLDFLEQLTGISGLIADPHFLGGGLHQIERGGFLKVHADFNMHQHLRLDRRLNVLVYLNRDWPEEYGGHLQLWDREMKHCERRVLPVFGRCVIFNTTDWSYHGHPDPLTCPEGVTRKSVALYYYSNGRPAGEVGPRHTTLFKARPTGEDPRPNVDGRQIVRRLAPPILVEAARSVRQRIRGQARP